MASIAASSLPGRAMASAAPIYAPIYTPIYTDSISAGFPSPADDDIEDRLDLNHLLVRHPAATFFMRVTGDLLREVGIRAGALLVVDRAIVPGDGHIVVAAVNTEMMVRRLCKKRGRLYLEIPGDRDWRLELREEMDFQIWGVVTSVIHFL